MNLTTEERQALEEIARLHDAAPAMYRALKAINAHEYVMMHVYSQATRQLIIEALRLAEGKPTK